MKRDPTLRCKNFALKLINPFYLLKFNLRILLQECDNSFLARQIHDVGTRYCFYLTGQLIFSSEIIHFVKFQQVLFTAKHMNDMFE